MDQRQHPTPPAGALQQAVPPPPQPLPPSRRRDRRLPRSGGKCPLIGRADIRLRVNISSVLNTFGPSGGGTDTHPSSPDSPSSPVWEQPRKRKRTEWLEVDSTVTLGTRPRNFIILLAEKCGILDIQKEIRDFMSAGSFSANNGTLPSLIAAHNHHSQNINVSAFWQSVIEIQIALRCERFDFSPPEPVWVYRSDDFGQHRKGPQGYLGSQIIRFGQGGDDQREVYLPPWGGEEIVPFNCRRSSTLLSPYSHNDLTDSQQPSTLFLSLPSVP